MRPAGMFLWVISEGGDKQPVFTVMFMLEG